MLCRDEAEVMEKLCDMADKFNDLYDQKKYLQAMRKYSAALTVALFMQADKDIMNFLFGYANSEETDEKGLFDRGKVMKATEICIMRGDIISPVYIRQ